MRSDVIKWAGISAGFFVVAYVLAVVLMGASGVEVYADDNEIAEMLQDIDDNEALVSASAVLGMASTIFIFPVLLGLLFALREEDRPWTVLASIFFVVGALVLILSSAAMLLLTGVASDFVDASGATKEALLQDGKLLQGLYQLFYVSPPMGIGLLLTGVLMLRSTFFHRLLAGLTLIIGIAGVLLYLWFIFIPGLPIWFLAVGWTMWSKSRASVAPAPV